MNLGLAARVQLDIANSTVMLKTRGNEAVSEKGLITTSELRTY
jgi:hypothetical protein